MITYYGWDINNKIVVSRYVYNLYNNTRNNHHIITYIHESIKNNLDFYQTLSAYLKILKVR